MRAKNVAKSLKNEFLLEKFNQSIDNIYDMEKLNCGLSMNSLNLMLSYYNKLTVLIENLTICDKNQIEKAYKI